MTCGDWMSLHGLSMRVAADPDGEFEVWIADNDSGRILYAAPVAAALGATIQAHTNCPRDGSTSGGVADTTKG